MELEFENRLDPKYDVWEEKYRCLGELVMKTLNIAANYEVDFSFVGDEDIHALNRDYRGVDRVTDVISFAFEDDENEKSLIVPSTDVPIMLGEIFICVPQALRQAKEYGNSEFRELSFLFVHGLLHLLGYDHLTKKDEDVMFPLQERILDIWGKENA